MANGLTINLQGSFTSNGSAHVLNLPSGLDSLWVYNQTVLYAAGAGYVAQSYWDTTMLSGLGTKYVKESTIGALVPSQYGAGLGFTLVDTSLNPISGTPLADQSISSGANPPVVGSTNTGSLSNGNVVRLYNQLGAQQLSGMDFTVGAVSANTSFTLAYMKSIAVAGTGGTYSIVNWDSPFYPRRRYITNISNAAQAIVTLSVTHQYTVGQQVRMVVPVASSGSLGWGMYQINGLTGNIVATGQADANGYTNTITLDINSSGFNAFVFPVTADYPITFAEVVPIGENTALSLASPVAQTPLDYFGNQIPNTQSGILADATVDTTIRGISLAGGTGGPAGANAAFITWSAMVAFSVNPLS